jgi:hypothetical protein
MDQFSEAFMCKKQFFIYFIFTSSLKFLLFLSYDALRICFLTHLVCTIVHEPHGYLVKIRGILSSCLSILRTRADALLSGSHGHLVIYFPAFSYPVAYTAGHYRSDRPGSRGQM